MWMPKLFKVRQYHINRITVEFKFRSLAPSAGLSNCILIESQWNLNFCACVASKVELIILIESQWNLNALVKNSSKSSATDINRITVEFKLIKIIRF